MLYTARAPSGGIRIWNVPIKVSCRNQLHLAEKCISIYIIGDISVNCGFNAYGETFQ